MVGKKMIFMAILGLAVIGGVNFFFFKVLKKTFKERKLIWLQFMFVPEMVDYQRLLLSKNI